MNEKLCVFCKHLYFYGGLQGYSEMTPGSTATMDCLKKHFSYDERNLFIMGADEYRKTILKAETCKDYEQVKL